MALTQLVQNAIAFKKLAGIAHTSAQRSFAEEPYSTNIQLATSTIFGEIITPPSNFISVNSTLGTLSPGGVGQLVEFTLHPIPGTDYVPILGGVSGTTIDDQGDNTGQSVAFHAYELRLPADYQTNSAYSTNPNRGTGNFVNNRVLHQTLGDLQLIPPIYGAQFYALVLDASNNVIGFTDAEDIYLDYYSGILFVQDQNFTGSRTPAKILAYLYIGKKASEVITQSSNNSGWTVDNVNNRIYNLAQYTRVDVNANLFVNGNLIVSGSQINVDSQNVNIGDNIITLNSFANVVAESGIHVIDPTPGGETGSIVWRNNTNRWYAGLAGLEKLVPVFESNTPTANRLLYVNNDAELVASEYVFNLNTNIRELFPANNTQVYRLGTLTNYWNEFYVDNIYVVGSNATSTASMIYRNPSNNKLTFITSNVDGAIPRYVQSTNEFILSNIIDGGSF